MKFSFFVLILLASLTGNASLIEIDTNPLKIFTYEKSINNENIMVVNTSTDENCSPLIDPETRTPSIDFYWLMNRKDYKPVNPIIKKNIRSRMTTTASTNKNIFYINLMDLSEVEIDLPYSRLTIETFKNKNKQCDVHATIKLGASDGNATLVLQRIFANVKKTFNPLRPKVISLTLEGMDTKTGVLVSRTYSAK